MGVFFRQGSREINLFFRNLTTTNRLKRGKWICFTQVFFTHSPTQLIPLPFQVPEFERDFYDSLLIVLDTLEKCLSSQAAEAPKYDDVMNVKLLLKEICQYLDMHDNSSSQVRKGGGIIMLGHVLA